MFINPSITDLLKDFIKNDIKTRSGVEAVVLCGSYATGKSTGRSDIDLCYIGDFPAFKREVVVYQNQEFQLMIAPWSWYEDVITDYERKEDNGGTITVMLAQGLCLYGESERWKQLSELARKYFDLGPCAVSDRIIRSIRIRITGLFDNYCDQSASTLNQSWLAFHVIQCCIESQFKIRKWWTVKPKYELEELYKKDSAMANLVEACLLTRGSDKDLIMKLCKYVLEPVGGLLRESLIVFDESSK